MFVSTYLAIQYHMPHDFSLAIIKNILLYLHLLHIPSASPVFSSHQCQFQLAFHQDMKNLACLLECHLYLGFLVICVCSKQNRVLMSMFMNNYANNHSIIIINNNNHHQHCHTIIIFLWVQLSLCLIKQHTMKTWEVDVQFYAFWLLSINGSLQLHTPGALLLEKAPGTPTDRICAFLRWMLLQTHKPSPPGIKPWLSVCSLSLATILTAVGWQCKTHTHILKFVNTLYNYNLTLSSTYGPGAEYRMC